jgi:hypothetical protein
VTAAQLQATLVGLLAGAVGGTAEHWASLLGEIEKRPSIEDIHSNWRVSPSATGEELRAINEALALVRPQHPYID